MSHELPHSVLFCCDHNSVRSPMAEGIMKAYYGQKIYVQSAGVSGDLEIDGFSIAVCEELDVKLSGHRVRSFQKLQEWGDDLSSFDLVVALSPASRELVLELTKSYYMDVAYWPIFDPTHDGTTREAKLVSYRKSRDQIITEILARFGPPTNL